MGHAGAVTGPRKKRWSELTDGQKRGIVAAGVVQVTLLALAAADLARRPAEQVRGPKWAWVPVLALNFVGPIAYLLLGRKGPSDAPSAPSPS